MRLSTESSVMNRLELAVLKLQHITTPIRLAD